MLTTRRLALRLPDFSFGPLVVIPTQRIIDVDEIIAMTIWCRCGGVDDPFRGANRFVKLARMNGLRDCTAVDDDAIESDSRLDHLQEPPMSNCQASPTSPP